MCIDRLLVFLLAFIIVSCNDKQVPTEQERTLIDQIEQILNVKQQLADKYWPEFNDEKYSVPIVFYAGSTCYVVNPEADFLRAFRCKQIKTDKFQLYKTDRIDSRPYIMETQVDLSFYTTTYAGKTPYAMCSDWSETQKMYPEIMDEAVWMASVIHELVHGCQLSHPWFYVAQHNMNHWVSDIVLTSYPSQHPWLCDALIEENDYLLSAISADDESEMKGFLRKFLSCRTERKNRMKAEFGESRVRNEEQYETDESLARFMELQAALLLGTDNPIYAEDSFYFCNNVQEDYHYITGYNLVRLFLKMGIDLDLPYNSVLLRSLDSYISID